MTYLYATSIDEEEWTIGNLDDAVQEQFDNIEAGGVGTTFEVYRGRLEIPNAKIFVPMNFFDGVCDNAYDAAGPSSDRWTDKISESKLHKDLGEWFKHWCEENKVVPDIGTIEDVATIQIRVTEVDSDGGLKEYMVKHRK